MQLLVGLFAVCLPALVLSDVITVQKCTDGTLPTAVDVPGCKSTPCELPKGHDAKVLVDFTASKQLTTLRPEVRASFGGLTVPFVLPNDRQDACKWLIGAQCPLSPQEDVTYELQLPVLSSYPSLSLTVELKLLDQSNDIVTCFQLAANVV
ncbi:NPC intracellular cholesterol transporter 2-like [Anopheles albimanus]|uniref:NPC intracellular cholesterol transporter 2-like n=1 Tax=Anopheles albimanus TaxID=7167 RepID=UPI0016403F64|nr:NPC intracellular cholesterol transporter 2-like [Anopheles albimanus]